MFGFNFGNKNKTETKSSSFDAKTSALIIAMIAGAGAMEAGAQNLETITGDNMKQAAVELNDMLKGSGEKSLKVVDDTTGATYEFFGFEAGKGYHIKETGPGGSVDYYTKGGKFVEDVQAQNGSLKLHLPDPKEVDPQGQMGLEVKKYNVHWHDMVDEFNERAGASGATASQQ